MTATNENRCGTTATKTVFRPLTDIREYPDSFVIQADLPGVQEKDLDITLDRNTLTVRGTVTPPVEPEGFNTLHREYEVGDFERSFRLGNEIERENIQATFEDGVLRLTLPKAKDQKVRKIPVKLDT